MSKGNCMPKNIPCKSDDDGHQHDDDDAPLPSPSDMSVPLLPLPSLLPLYLTHLSSITRQSMPCILKYIFNFSPFHFSFFFSTPFSSPRYIYTPSLKPKCLQNHSKLLATMRPAPQVLLLLVFIIVYVLCRAPSLVSGWRPWPNLKPNSSHLLYSGSKKFEGSSEFVHLRYHMGPVLTENITIHAIWYGTWEKSQKKIIREFIGSISAFGAKRPSVSGWWKTVQLYTDQTGSNISRTVRLGEEKNDRFYSHGKTLTRLSIQSVIKSAVTATTKPLPINPKSGLYLLLTSADVYVQDFCGQVCGFHYFTFPSIVGYTLPYAWVGNSAKQCPGVCAYPFSVPQYMPGLKPLKSPNGDVGVDGMISVIGHEIAELATNPLVNAWYAGRDPSFPVEIADLCEGIYGTGGGGSYTGQLLEDHVGATYNMNGIGRRYLVQWVWNHVVNYCTGPNALDQ